MDEYRFARMGDILCEISEWDEEDITEFIERLMEVLDK
jgi:hypothetical protein